jgi:hypothetical protein
VNHRAESGSERERKERVPDNNDAGDVEQLRLDIEARIHGTTPPTEERYEQCSEATDHHCANR